MFLPIDQIQPKPFTNVLIWVGFHFFLRKPPIQLKGHEFDQIQPKPIHLHTLIGLWCLVWVIVLD